MPGTELHWVNGPWPGKLALSARPRDGGWLEDEIANWRRSGIDTVLSLLERKKSATSTWPAKPLPSRPAE